MSVIRYCVGFLLVLGVVFGIPTWACSKAIYFNDFEHEPVGVYSKDLWKKYWPDATGYHSSGIGDGRVHVVRFRGDNVLEVIYEKGKSHKGGVRWRMRFSPVDSVFFFYRFRFCKGFYFSKGGKLPGIGGGRGNVGGYPSNGYDGFSIRFMWYSSGTKGSVVNPRLANLVVYVYYPGQHGKYGDVLKLKRNGKWVTITSGRWYFLRAWVKLNQVGYSNGVLMVWLNGKPVFSRGDFVFRYTNSLKIDQFLFHTFFGGHSRAWDAREKECSMFDDIGIETGGGAE